MLAGHAPSGHPMFPLTDNWTRGAAGRHIIAPLSRTTPSLSYLVRC